MNVDESVTEAHRDFVRWISLVFDPISRLVDGLLDFRDDSMCLDADIPVSRAILTRPTPHVAKHPLVQFAQKRPIENIASAGFGPALSGINIDVLCFIQLVPQCDVGRDERFVLLNGEGRVRLIIAIEPWIRHDDPVRRPTDRVTILKE